MNTARFSRVNLALDRRFFGYLTSRSLTIPWTLDENNLPLLSVPIAPTEKALDHYTEHWESVERARGVLY